jgi:hypothetical protein
VSLNQFGRSPFSWRLLLLTPPAFWSLVASASIVVANYGTDSGSCGSSAEPCRSISQAIAYAAPNEVIYVGAGRYGDVSGTGTFAGPGDERAQSGIGDDIDYQSCVICIFKPVQIYSLNGSAVTYIQANSAASFQNAVYINSAGVTFGSPGHGFTINNGGGNGVVVDFEATGPSSQPMNVTVAGNVDVADAQGFVFVGSKYGTSGPGSICPQAYCPPGYSGRILFQGNRANGSGTGFWIEPRTMNCCGFSYDAFVNGQVVVHAIPHNIQVVLENNIAIGTQTGFFVAKGVIFCDGCGDYASANDVTLENNFASGNQTGFDLSTAGLVSQNVAIGNGIGFSWAEPAGAFSYNSAIGNMGPGVIISTFSNSGPATITLSHSNFYGNDRNRPSGSSAHCAIMNLGATNTNAYVTDEVQYDTPAQPPYPTVTVNAADSFWGSAKGPGGAASADVTGGACDRTGGQTVASGVQAAPVAIPTPPAT